MHKTLKICFSWNSCLFVIILWRVNLCSFTRNRFFMFSITHAEQLQSISSILHHSITVVSSMYNSSLLNNSNLMIWEFLYKFHSFHKFYFFTWSKTNFFLDCLILELLILKNVCKVYVLFSPFYPTLNWYTKSKLLLKKRYKKKISSSEISNLFV